MHIQSLAFILLSSLLVFAKAQPSRSYRLAYYNAPAKIKGLEKSLEDSLSSTISSDDDYEDAYTAATSRKSNNPSTGRLFFSKLFGNNNRQPIIPIIITGANSGSTGNTVTSTATIPQATGTITTSPVAARQTIDGEEGEAEEESEIEATKDEELQNQKIALQNAIAQAAQEYVVANGPIKPMMENDMSELANVREKDDKNKFITVRIPAKYRKYFKNGQRVHLRRPNNKSNNRRRRNRNRNRRGRN